MSATIDDNGVVSETELTKNEKVSEIAASSVRKFNTNASL